MKIPIYKLKNISDKFAKYTQKHLSGTVSSVFIAAIEQQNHCMKVDLNYQYFFIFGQRKRIVDPLFAAPVLFRFYGRAK